MRKKSLSFAFILFIILPVSTHAEFSYNSNEFQHVVDQLNMDGHSEHELSTCSVKKVYFEEITEMLNNGKSEQEIIEYYTKELGQSALKIPGNDTAGLLAWVMPAIGFLSGVIVLSVIVKRLMKKNEPTFETALNYKVTGNLELDLIAKTLEEERKKHF